MTLSATPACWGAGAASAEYAAYTAPSAPVTSGPRERRLRDPGPPCSTQQQARRGRGTAAARTDHTDRPGGSRSAERGRGGGRLAGVQPCVRSPRAPANARAAPVWPAVTTVPTMPDSIRPCPSSARQAHTRRTWWSTKFLVATDRNLEPAGADGDRVEAMWAVGCQADRRGRARASPAGSRRGRDAVPGAGDTVPHRDGKSDQHRGRRARNTAARRSTLGVKNNFSSRQ
jgi:hypothetical protein